MAIAKKLTASAIASSLLLAIAGPAFAADQTVDSIANKMFDLGIIKGNGTDLNLGGTLTRAELITTIVRSFGLENAALLSKGAPSFADVSANEWYSGWVAVAKNLAEQKGLQLGVGNNNFNPNGQLSKVEALVFVMKFLGVAPATTTANWQDAWINEAVARGIITEAQGTELAAEGTTPSTRGEAFVILDRGYSFKDANGKSLYTTNIDSQLPTLTLTPAATTTESEIALSGSVADNKGIASVVINGEAVEVANGAFSTKAALTVGKNEITVVVTDLAGNVLTKTYEVVRGNVDADAIEASDITVTAGATANVEAKLVDKNGEAIADAAITGTSTLGTFENGVFTAGTTAGEGTLTLKSGDITKTVKVSVAAGALAKISVPTSVAVNATPTLVGTDSFGNAISGVTWSVKTGSNAFINANGVFTATASGNYTVVATLNGTSVEGNVGVYDATVASLKVEAANEVVANGTTEVEVTVKALDANGNFIPTATGNVAITANGLNATGLTTGNIALTNGAGTFKVTASNAVVGQTLAINANLGGKTGTASIKAVAQVATDIAITTADDYVDTTASGATKAVTVTVRDQAGVAMIDGEYAINLSITGPATFAQGATTKSVNWNKYVGSAQTIYATEIAASGAISISATANGLTAGTKVLTAAVPQTVAAIKVTAPESTEYTVADATTAVVYKVGTTDKYGVPKAFAGSFKLVIGGIDMTDADQVDNFVVEYSTNGGTSYTTATDLNNIPGTVNAIRVTGTVAGAYSVQLLDAASTPALTASAVTSFSVKAGAINKLVAPTTTSYEALRGDKVTVKYQVTDVQGNALKVAGIKVTTGNPALGLKVNGSASAVTVETDANGVATFELVADKLGALNLPIASVKNGTADLAFVSSGITLTAVDAVVGSFDVTAANGSDATKVFVSAGENATLTVNVKDNLGYDFTSMADAAAFKAAFNLSVNGEAVAWTTAGVSVTGSNGSFTVSGIKLTKAGAATLTLTTAKLAEAKSATATISVKAGAADRLVIVGAEAATTNGELTPAFAYSADTTANVAKLYTVQLADAFGNVINASDNGTDRAIALTYSNAATQFVLFADQDGVGIPANTLTIAAGRNTASFYATTSAESGDITVANTVTTGTALKAAKISLK